MTETPPETQGETATGIELNPALETTTEHRDGVAVRTTYGPGGSDMTENTKPLSESSYFLVREVAHKAIERAAAKADFFAAVDLTRGDKKVWTQEEVSAEIRRVAKLIAKDIRAMKEDAT